MIALRQEGSLRGEMRRDEPFARHTTWRVGGPARCFYRPADSADLISFLQQLPEGEPIFWLGLGSNLLVRDGGFNGTVIATRDALNEIAGAGPRRLRVEAGVSCARVARIAAQKGLCGVEFLAGIPGTFGGALAMNAGAFGGETWQRVVVVETLDHHGVVRCRRPEEFEIGYRHVRGPEGEWFLAATLELEPGDVVVGQGRIRELLDRRAQTQPIGLPSCGSVFRNPPGDHAARLIEAAGLKGTRLGGAEVSAKHANFIVNTGGATAAEIEGLIGLVQRRVLEQFGVRLETEVRIVGEAQ